MGYETTINEVKRIHYEPPFYVLELYMIKRKSVMKNRDHVKLYMKAELIYNLQYIGKGKIEKKTMIVRFKRNNIWLQQKQSTYIFTKAKGKDSLFFLETSLALVYAHYSIDVLPIVRS